MITQIEYLQRLLERQIQKNGEDAFSVKQLREQIASLEYEKERRDGTVETLEMPIDTHIGGTRNPKIR
jgi:hypothetical protein